MGHRVEGGKVRSWEARKLGSWEAIELSAESSKLVADRERTEGNS